MTEEGGFFSQWSAFLSEDINKPTLDLRINSVNLLGTFHFISFKFPLNFNIA